MEPLLTKAQILPEEQQAFSFVATAKSRKMSIRKYKSDCVRESQLAVINQKYVITGERVRHGDTIWLRTYFVVNGTAIELNSRKKVPFPALIPEDATEEIGRSFFDSITMPEE